MFGLVLRSTLLDAERRVVKFKLLLREARKERDAAAAALIEANADLKGERSVREAAQAEVARLMEIIKATTAEPAEPDTEKPAADAQPSDVPRMLTGIEVVSRATRHRNVHNKAGER
jgi:hypothetical protein